jgi:hypothetical protein
VLRWAQEHHCPWDSDTCTHAAMYGHLPVLKWAREHDCPWGWQTCAFAARAGHLEVMQWARDHGAPWDEAFVREQGRHQDTLVRWLAEHGDT